MLLVCIRISSHVACIESLAWYCQFILSLVLFKTQELINTILLFGTVSNRVRMRLESP